MHVPSLHQHLIGQPGSRAALNTPALVLDLEALDRNIAAMADFSAGGICASGPTPRPTRASTSPAARSPPARWACAAPSWARPKPWPRAGSTGLLITSPVVGEAGVRRLVALAARSPGLMAVADHPDAVGAIGAPAEAAGQRLTLLVDLDPGLSPHRSRRRRGGGGPRPPDRRPSGADVRRPAILLRAGTAHPGLRRPARGHRPADRAVDPGPSKRSPPRASPPPLVTGGGTGSHAIDVELGLLSELQPGSYVFMDREYGDCELRPQEAKPFETALMIDARVISANHTGMVDRSTPG